MFVISLRMKGLVRIMNNRIYHILYSIMVIVVVAMVAWPAINHQGQSVVEESFPEPVAFSSGWVTEDGTEVDTSKLRYLEGTKVYEEFSIYNTVPENIAEGQYLCFRSKNIFYKIYLNGELVYEPYVPQSDVYNDSLGTRWNYVPLHLEDGGRQIEIRVMKVYESATSSLDNMYIGEPARAVMDTVGEKLVAFITSILLLFVGVILIVADIPINRGEQKNHELAYLGLFALSIATWCLVETHLLTFYIGNSRIMQLISCCSLMLIAIPLTLYLDAAFGFRRKAIVSGMVGISFGSFVVCMLLHFTGVADVHETLNLSHIVLVLSAVILLYTIIVNIFHVGNKENNKADNAGGKVNVYSILRGLGLGGLSVATVIDLFRYYKGSNNDAAMFVRIGLLIFVLCFGVSTLEKTINAVKLGARAEFMSQLAYKNGLTGVGNRTAFKERFGEYMKDEDISVGILMFDINDLKFVNDNIGHHAGDKMLMQSSDMIKEAFLQVQGECFRIGGDEFVVLVSGEDVASRCEKGIRYFEEAMHSYNQQPEKEFRVSIAVGYDIYNNNLNGTTLVDIYQSADSKMYENKKKMKDTQIKPEEYYKDMLKK